jgi:replicative DNA helicase
MALDTLRDHDAEAQIIGFLIVYPGYADVATDHLAAGDFDDPRWAACWTLWQPGLHGHELADRANIDRGVVDRAITDAPSPGLAASLVAHLADLSARRQTKRYAAELSAMAEDPARTVQGLVDYAQLEAGQLTVPLVVGPPDLDIDEFIAKPRPVHEWVVPGVLRTGDRMLITATEGDGKSVMLAQIAVCAGAGIHPWTFQPERAVNVLYVDLENGESLVQERLEELRGRVDEARFDPARVRVISRHEGIDVTRRSDAMWLAERVAANMPELLVIGPAYRLYAGSHEHGDIGGEDMARQVTASLDRIRARHHCALVMETHAPHKQGATRDLRPFGSSVWLRWPEFGIGLKRDSDTRFAVKHWRGPRAQRQWPKYFDRGGKWPWTGIYDTGTF